MNNGTISMVSGQDFPVKTNPLTLVNVQKTMERSTMFLMGKSTVSDGPFSIATLNYQRVYQNMIKHGVKTWWSKLINMFFFFFRKWKERWDKLVDLVGDMFTIWCFWSWKWDEARSDFRRRFSGVERFESTNQETHSLYNGHSFLFCCLSYKFLTHPCEF